MYLKKLQKYRLSSEDWVYCKNTKKIDNCLDFDRLELKTIEKKCLLL